MKAFPFEKCFEVGSDFSLALSLSFPLREWVCKAKMRLSGTWGWKEKSWGEDEGG